MRILFTAGEPSGDLHGAHVIAALRTAFPAIEIDAVGGPRMADAGATMRRSIDGLSAMGLVEILGKIPAHWRLERELVHDFRARRYDLLIPIDYPGFHMRLARQAKRHGIPVLWYIAPQFWAWWPGRAAGFARMVDRLAVILPFEAEFFRQAGLEATFVGHPLLDNEPLPERCSSRRSLGLTADAKVLALFPGSRQREIAALWPMMRDAAAGLLASGDCTEILVAGTAWGRYPNSHNMQVIRDDPAHVLSAADAVIAKSGTTTLQAALAGVPMVVAYTINALSARLVRPLVTARWFALPNLIAGRQVVPELLQNGLTVNSLIDSVRPLLDSASEPAQRQRDGLAEVRRCMGGPGASARVARLAGELLVA